MRIAVAGSGIAGLAAAWLLDRAHEVHLFERRERLGGHTHTYLVDSPDGDRIPIDSGFIVYNEPTYPLLTRLFDELGVATEPSGMSWSLRCERHDLEYAGSLGGVLAQPRNLADPDYLRLLRDIVRFGRIGRRLVDDPRTRNVPVGRFLRTSRLSPSFADHYLEPMAAAIWSTGTGPIRDFPLHTLLRFFDNHGLLGVTTHHPWRTVSGGAASYIPELTRDLVAAGRVHTGTGVEAVERDEDGVTVRTTAGSDRFDALVVAAHADQALAMLADPSPLEKELLGAWDYTANDAWLHTDPALLPRTARARASWNYLLDDCREGAARPSLSYHMNRLQNLEADRDYLVSLNPPAPPAPEHRIARMTYDHPVYSRRSVATQPDLDELNGSGAGRTFYAGAYHRYGFHEDGLWSAVRAAAHLGVDWP